MRQSIFLITALLSLAWVSPALAADDDVILKLTAMKEIIVKNKEGKDIIKHVKPEVMTPGDIVVYTLSFANEGKKAKDDVVINDPISAELAYIAGSATGPGTTISFSADGKSFAPEGQVKIKGSDGKMRLADTSEYRHIRWTLNGKLAAGKEGHGSFKARVK